MACLARSSMGSATQGFASSSRSISTTSRLSANIAPPAPPIILTWPSIKPHPHTKHHTATISLRSYETQNLDLYTQFALQSAHSLQIPTSNPASLPTTKSLYTVVKSPFVHKKAQENFERKTHRRVIKVFDADKEIVDLWLRYLRKNSIGGVGIKAQIWERVEYGFAKKEGESMVQQVESGGLDAEKIEKAADDLVKELSSGDSVAEVAETTAGSPEAPAETAQAAKESPSS